MNSGTTGVARRALTLVAGALALLAAPAAAHATTLGCSGEQPTGNVDLPTWSAGILHHTNAHRVSRGLRPLQLDVGLVRAAQWKARDQAARGYFAHVDAAAGTAPARSPWERLRECGHGRGGIRTENIHGGRHLATPEQVVQEWLASPGHRSNIESPVVRYIGIGAARNPLAPYAGHQQREWYFVQLFASTPSPAALGGFPVLAPVGGSARVRETSTEPAVVRAAPDGAGLPWAAAGLVITGRGGVPGTVELADDDRSVSFGPTPGSSGRATITVDTLNLFGQRSGRPATITIDVLPREATRLSAPLVRIERRACRAAHGVRVGRARWCLRVAATATLRTASGAAVANATVRLTAVRGGRAVPVGTSRTDAAGRVTVRRALTVPAARRRSLLAALRWARAQHAAASLSFAGTADLAPSTSPVRRAR